MSPIDPFLFSLLQDELRSKQPLAVAVSGGMDSTTLAMFCLRQGLKHVCFTVIGPHVTDHEIRSVLRLRAEHGLKHIFFYFDYNNHQKIVANSHQRCRYCKHHMFSGPSTYFSDKNTIVDGTNFSDAGTYRPGMISLKELGVVSPFYKCGYDRARVIELSRQLGLNPGLYYSRSCVLTRFAYGIPLDPDLVDTIRTAENYLLDQGLSGFRMRVLCRGEYLLQVDVGQEVIFSRIRPDFDAFARELGLVPYTLQVIPFESITGFFD